MLDVPELPGGEETRPNVPDRSLNTPLLVPSSRCRELRLEAVVRRNLEQGRVEHNGVAFSLDAGALEVVVDDLPRHPAEERQSVHVSAQEAGTLHVVKELQPRHPRPAQRHHEGVQRAAGSSDVDMPEVPPVDLGLLASEHVQTGKRLGLGPRPHRGDESTKVRLAALISAIADM